MSGAADLTALLARVEAADGPERYADCWLACAFDGFLPKQWPLGRSEMSWRVDFCRYRDGGLESPGHGGAQMVPDYTASLDAALALCERVLPGCEYRLIGGPETGDIEAWASATITTMNWPAKRNHSADELPTPALALLAAMLKALIAQAATAAPEPPWPPGAATNAKRKGWVAFFEGRSREDCPFPPARGDLQDGYREGWDAAAAHGRVKA